MIGFLVLLNCLVIFLIMWVVILLEEGVLGILVGVVLSEICVVFWEVVEVLVLEREVFIDLGGGVEWGGG